MGEIPFGLEDMSQEDSMQHLAHQRQVFLVRACRYNRHSSAFNGRHLEDAADDLTDAMRLVLDWISLEKNPTAQAAMLAKILRKEAAAHYRLFNVVAGQTVIDFEPANRIEVEAEITRELQHNGKQALDSLFETYQKFMGSYRETLDGFHAGSSESEAAHPSPEEQTRIARITGAGIGAGLIIVGGMLFGKRSQQS